MIEKKKTFLFEGRTIGLKKPCLAIEKNVSTNRGFRIRFPRRRRVQMRPEVKRENRGAGRKIKNVEEGALHGQWRRKKNNVYLEG